MDKTRIVVSDVYLLDMNSKEETRIFDELVIGRTECDLEFPHDTLISRRHLRLIPADDVVMVEDLGSTNKTLVNGKLLRPNVLYKLRSRDVIEFGKQKCQVFIGGKIADDPKAPRASAEDTAVLSKLMASPEKSKAGKEKKNSGRDLDGLEDFSVMDTVPTFEESEVAIARLANERGVSWFLQFDGSEFGPLNFNEMKAIVSSERFQGGELFVWAEGIPSWTLISKSHKIFQGSAGVVDQAPPKEFSSPVPLVAMVVWTKTEAGEKRKITATCETISATEISVICAEKISDTKEFEVEVSPRKGLGLDRFKLTVKFDPNRVGKKGYTLEITSVGPKTKAMIERHVREYHTGDKD